jgi:hypothetical protein
VRKINIDGRELGLKATVSVLFPYHKKFDTSIMADIQKIQGMLEKMGEANFENFNAEIILRVVWALNKNYEDRKDFPELDEWVNQFENINFGDPEFLPVVAREGINGFFRSSKKTGRKPE